MKRLIVSGIVLLVAAGTAVGVIAWYRANPEPVTYRTAEVKRSDILVTISATGTLVPEEVIDVGTQVNGQIVSFGLDHDGKPIDYRSAVDEGAVLARIDDSLYAADFATSQAQHDQAEAQVNTATAAREQARAKLNQSTRDWERAQRLGEKAALSKADFDAAQSAYEQAEAAIKVADAAVAQAQAQVALATASLQRSQRNLGYCVIKSPVSGVVLDRRVDIGQTVVASLNAPSLFLLAKDLRRMQVLVQVNEADVGSVQPGEHVHFAVDAFPGTTFVGEVRKVRLNATMTQNVVTYTVEITTDNSDLKLLPYLTANVTFEITRRDQVLAVPNAALRWSPREAVETPKGAKTGTVWVKHDGQPAPVEIGIGATDGTVTEVTSGDLKEGDRVIIGEQNNGKGAPVAAGDNPFAPRPFGRGGGGGGGGGAGGRGR